MFLELSGFLCGALISVQLELVGNLFLGEPLLVIAATTVFLIRGFGPIADGRILLVYLTLGLVMLVGYAVADLVSQTEPWQYQRGWARIATLVLTTGALIMMASHAPRSLWWFALGLGLGMLTKLVIDGVPFDQWKLGYAEALVLLVVTFGGLVSIGMAAAGLLAFGLLSVVLDYRSLGALAILIAACLVVRRYIGSHRRWRARDAVLLAVVGVATVTVLVLTLALTEDQYQTRRTASNLGRYAGLTVAAEAIADSPIVGNGSWAADRKYLLLIRREEARASSQVGYAVRIGDSLMPHSQVLQAWLEGGALAAAYFLIYGCHLLAALWWLVRGRRFDAMTPLYLYAVSGGLFNWIASPGTGIHRVYIALAVAVIAVLACERQMERRSLQSRPEKVSLAFYAAGSRRGHDAPEPQKVM